MCGGKSHLGGRHTFCHEENLASKGSTIQHAACLRIERIYKLEFVCQHVDDVRWTYLSNGVGAASTTGTNKGKTISLHFRF